MPQSANPTRIAALDGWRGIAILLVLADHLNTAAGRPLPLTSIGQHGVGLFFVLSGYLITSVLLREMRETGSASLRAFYIRRLFRLQPIAWLFLASLLFIIPALHRGEPSPLELLSCVFLSRNYFPHGSWTGHFWSLAIEEQFYLVWPSILILLRPKWALRVAAAGAAIVAIWRYAHWNLIVLPGDASFLYSTHTQYRADGLLIGCAFALLPTIKKRWMTWISLIVFAAYICTEQPIIPLSENIAIGILISGTVGARNPILTNRVLTKIGLVSYSIYVWQSLIIFTAPTASLSITALKLAAVISFGFFSYYAIERPMIRLGTRIIKTRAERRPLQRVTAPAGLTVLLSDPVAANDSRSDVTA